MSIDRDIRRLTKKLQTINAIEIPRGSSKALNDTASKIRTRVIKGVSKSARIPQKEVRKKVYLRRSTVRTQTARISVYTRPVSAISLVRKQTAQARLGSGTNKSGVTAGGRSWPSAFIQKGLNGNVQVFRRTGIKHTPTKGRYAGKRREQLEAVKIPIQKEAEQVTRSVSRRVYRDEFPRTLARELKYRLNKYVTK